MGVSHLFFFNDTATTEIYTLSLHDALPISLPCDGGRNERSADQGFLGAGQKVRRELGLEDITQGPGSERSIHVRSEEHTSELQSQSNIVCRLLLEKKKLGANLSAVRTVRER